MQHRRRRVHRPEIGYQHEPSAQARADVRELAVEPIESEPWAATPWTSSGTESRAVVRPITARESCHFTSVMSGFPLSTTYVASSAPVAATDVPRQVGRSGRDEQDFAGLDLH